MSKDARINNYIRAKQIRLIGINGEQIGVVDIKRGLDTARENELDLVEVAPNANPPVCRIMDYSKYKYEQAKKEREAKKHQKAISVKEIKLKPKIGEHDYQVKLMHAQRFFKEKNKVKFTMVFRGRERERMDLGREILNRLINDLAGLASSEKLPTSEGRNIIMVMGPK